MQWLKDNKEWLFSGAGISLLMVIGWIVQKLYHNRSHPKALKAVVAVSVICLIALIGWGFSSGYLTAQRQFSWMHIATPVLLGIGVSGWIAYSIAQNRVGALTSELTTVKTHDTFRDHITQVLNTNAISHTFVECLSIAKAQGGNFSALLLDLDGFKRVNELHDIKGGDRCLRAVAVLLSKTLRGESDKLLRYRHGDEFLILLPETSAENAEFVAKRITRLIEKAEFPVDDENTENLTASVTYTGVDINSEDLDAATTRLEKGLKRAKRTRNTYVKA